jgi:N-acyl-phosphatidylethanolamine-hydrolysing phospholipase D
MTPAPAPLFTGLLRWAVTRSLEPRRERTPRGAFPRAIPTFTSPRAPADRTSLTWIGHASFLIQVGGLNLLTDPMWSDRASPFSFAGPRRYMPPGIPFEGLPPVDLVLLTHDHYDHFDDPTIRRLHAEHPDAAWLAPMGHGSLLAARGVRGVHELDWWDTTMVERLRLTALPAQHFSGRTFHRNRTLWCGWAVSASAHRIYFAGDTGKHSSFDEIGRRAGPFDAALLPIGAYDPRWFMAPVHMDPDEAVAAYGELVSAADQARPCRMVGMHWGTFRLTDEPMREPPERAARAWRAAGRPQEHLWIMAHGETRWL